MALSSLIYSVINVINNIGNPKLINIMFYFRFCISENTLRHCIVFQFVSLNTW